MTSTCFSTCVRCLFAGAMVFAFVSFGMGKGSGPRAGKSAEDVPLVRAKYMAFYGSNRSDWVTIASPLQPGSPLTWKILKNPATAPAQISIFNWGINTDTITANSWTGDARFDPGIWRNGLFWLLDFNGGGVSNIYWGASGHYVGRDGDYDGDGIADATMVVIPNNDLQWWIKLSSAPGTYRVVTFGRITPGLSTFGFQGADFNGDGRDEIVIAQSNNTTGAVTWYAGDAVTGALVLAAQWGNFSLDDIINPADYTGDGRADLVVWRSHGTGADANAWYILNAATGTQAPRSGTIFGIGANDYAIRGDYDGDGIQDIAVWRHTTATFYVLASSNGSLIAQQWGSPDDVPLAGQFIF